VDSTRPFAFVALARSTVMAGPLQRRAVMKPDCHQLQRSTAPLSTDLGSLHAAQSGPTPAATAPREPREVHVTIEARETQW